MILKRIFTLFQPRLEVMPGEELAPIQLDKHPPETRTAPGVRRPRRIGAKLLLLLVSVGLALFVCELGVRLGIAVTHRVPLVVNDERVGWALQPNLRNEVRADLHGRYVISTDAEGHRLTHPPGQQPAATNTVLLVGDSFVQGQAVDDKDTFAWVLASGMSVNVVNLGVLGYGTDQELIGLEAFLETHPSLLVRDVVVVVFDNDFLDVQVDYHPALGRSKPRFRITDGRLERSEYRLSWSDRFMDISALYWLGNSKRALIFKAPEPHPAGGIELVVACLSAMRRVVEERGARFHVLAHRHLRRPEDISEAQWKGFLQRTGGVDMTPRLRRTNGPDLVGYDNNHWNAVGHAYVAALVNEQLESAVVPKQAAPAGGPTEHR
jgi:hypothetical protein